MFFDTYINPKGHISEPKFCQTAIETFNSATIGFHKSGLEIDHSQVKPVIEWASKHFQNLTGNALINFPYTPSYFKNIVFAETEDLVKQKIQEAVRSYPQINKWVIFNELVGNSGYSRIKTNFCDKTRAIHPIIRIPNYIEKCFLWAIEANPQASYIINDYHPHNKIKWQSIFRIVDSLLEKGIPVEIGIQHHTHLLNRRLVQAAWNGFFLWQESRDLARKAKQREIEISFTENSIWNNTVPGTSKSQALMYKQLAQCALDEGVSLFNIWSLTDKPGYHWFYRPEDRNAGIFDCNYQPKLSYWYLKEVIRF